MLALSAFGVTDAELINLLRRRAKYRQSYDTNVSNVACERVVFLSFTTWVPTGHKSSYTPVTRGQYYSYHSSAS